MLSRHHEHSLASSRQEPILELLLLRGFCYCVTLLLFCSFSQHGKSVGKLIYAAHLGNSRGERLKQKEVFNGGRPFSLSLTKVDIVCLEEFFSSVWRKQTFIIPRISSDFFLKQTCWERSSRLLFFFFFLAEISFILNAVLI